MGVFKPPNSITVKEWAYMKVMLVYDYTAHARMCVYVCVFIFKISCNPFIILLWRLEKFHGFCPQNLFFSTFEHIFALSDKLHNHHRRESKGNDRFFPPFFSNIKFILKVTFHFMEIFIVV